MIQLFLRRKKHTDKQVIGILEIYKDDIFVGCLSTLEQEDNNNEIGNSCIPKGPYPVEHHSSRKYPNVLVIKNAEPRTGILIHNGVYFDHTGGCVLVGYAHTDINKDGYLDIIYSRAALAMLMRLCKGEDNITIEIS